MYVGGDILARNWLSGDLWRNLPVDAILAGNRKAGIGFVEDFMKVGDTTLEDGYIRLQTATGTVTQITSEADAPGICRLSSLADNDEAVIQLGNGLDVGAFRLQKPFAFEARIRLNAAAIVAGDHSFLAGMVTGGAAGGAIADKLFTGSDIGFVDIDAVGFQKLAAESTALDGLYQTNNSVTTEDFVDGGVNTDLDTVHTFVADEWVKVGFRFDIMRPRSLEYFVNGVKVATIGETDVTAAAFPDADTAFIQPTIGIRGADATSAFLDIDWMACAQLL